MIFFFWCVCGDVNSLFGIYLKGSAMRKNCKGDIF
jgi:hypothetical protein